MSELGPNEMLEADNRHLGKCPCHVKCPAEIVNPEITKHMQQRAQNGQDGLNQQQNQELGSSAAGLAAWH